MKDGEAEQGLLDGGDSAKQVKEFREGQVSKRLVSKSADMGAHRCQEGRAISLRLAATYSRSSWLDR